MVFLGLLITTGTYAVLYVVVSIARLHLLVDEVKKGMVEPEFDLSPAGAV